MNNMDDIIIALRQSKEYRDNYRYKIEGTDMDVLTFNYLTSMLAKKIARGLSMDESLVEAINIGKEIGDNSRIFKILSEIGLEEPRNLENGINDYKHMAAGEEGDFMNEAKAVSYAEIISLLAHQLREKFYMKVFGGELVIDLICESKKEGKITFGDRNKKLLKEYESKYKKIYVEKVDKREFTQDK